MRSFYKGEVRQGERKRKEKETDFGFLYKSLLGGREILNAVIAFKKHTISRHYIHIAICLMYILWISLYFSQMEQACKFSGVVRG